MPPQFTFQLAAHSYFRSYENYFWQWEEQGTIIGIPNGRTIAYTPFVAETLGHLKDQGLPRFGTLLLTILATSRNPEIEISLITTGLRHKYPHIPQQYLAFLCGEKFLLELAKLPQSYKEGKRRLLTLQTIFQSLQHPIRHFFADDIVNLISRKRINQDVLLRKEIIDPKAIYADFEPFIHLLNIFPNAEAIIKAMGELPEVEEEIPLPEETPEPAIDFLQELRQNPETADIAPLIPLIWSALEIPRHNRLPDRQPMGGVAGLSNKGEAHRLLVSEFANDDLLLLSRLANNEALYLNRETPPQSDDRERVLLVDVSLKNWGTPHTVAFALMLAIARQPKSAIPCSAFAVHEHWQPLRFGDIHQVIDSLLVLEPCLHPAQGIERFFRENPEKRQAEVFLLTTADTLRLPAMATLQLPLSYWLLSDHEGKVDVYKKLGEGRRHVKSFQLPHEELWKNKRPQRKEDLFTAYSRFSCPMLFYTPPMIKAVLPLGEDQYIVTRFNALMKRYGKSSRYWKLILENLPSSADHFEIGEMDSGEHILLAFSSQSRKLDMVNLDSGSIKRLTLDAWEDFRHKGFVFYRNRFHCPGKGYTISFNPLNNYPVGDVSEKEDLLLHLLEERTTARESSRQMLPPPGKVFTNIDRVWINEYHHLVFNDRELIFENDHFYLKPFWNKEPACCHAEATAKNAFLFPNGSQVIIHPAGMLILKGGPSDVFVSSVAEKSLCLIADNYFTGNENHVNRDYKMEYFRPFSFSKKYLGPFIQNITKK